MIDTPKSPRPRASGRVIRSAIFTLVAFAFAFLFRPDGLGIFVGLAVFQVAPGGPVITSPAPATLGAPGA